MADGPPTKPRPRGRPPRALPDPEVAPAHATIRDRQLTQSRPAGGHVQSVRLAPIDGGWGMYVQVSWRTGELLVLQWGAPIPKIYKTTDNAIRHCRERYAYSGAITVTGSPTGG